MSLKMEEFSQTKVIKHASKFFEYFMLMAIIENYQQISQNIFETI